MALAAISIGLALLLGLAALAFDESRRWSEHLRALARGRSGDALCQLARSVDLRQVEPRIVRAVHGELTDYLPHAPFPLRADDRILADLGVDDEDFGEMLVRIARTAERSLGEWRGTGRVLPVITIRDLILFVQTLPGDAASTSNHRPWRERVRAVFGR